MPITTIHDLLEYFPSSSETGSERNTACPFCRPEAKVVYHRGRAFYGTDRLVWFDSAVWCRRCSTYLSLTDLAKEFDSDSELVITSEPKEKKIQVTPRGVTEAFVLTMHDRVQKDFWYGFGWTDELIDKYHLGYGPVQPGSEKGDRHLIPFQAQSFEFDGLVWVMEGRSANPADIKAHGRNIKTGGVRGKVFTHIKSGASSSLAVCEGMKDAITLDLLGYRHVLMLPGTKTWSDDMGEYLKHQGYDRIEVFADNDQAGHDLALEIGTFFRNDLVETVYLRWPSSYKEGFDLTDLLVKEGPEQARNILNKELKTAPMQGYVVDYSTVDPNYLPDKPSRAKSVQQIRKELPTIIDEYLINYRRIMKSYKKPVVKVLASPPGSGKSYQMVRAAQDIATTMLEAAQKERERIEELIADEVDEEVLAKSHRNLSKLPEGQIVLYAGPFRAGWNDIINQPCYDEDMWYFFDSRNETNCQNIDIAKVLGAKGYSVKSYCKTGCPFREKCMESGYLKQFEDIADKPIAYVRHQHLLDTELLGQYKVLMIDENPLKVFEQKDRIHANDLRPSVETWTEYVSASDAQALEDLMLMLRRVLNDSMSEYTSYTGKDFFDRLTSVGDLDGVLKSISVEAIERFQPQMPLLTDGVKLSDLPGRKVPNLLHWLLEEYPKYLEGNPYNSRISLVNRSIEFYGLERVQIGRYTPVVVSDGTAYPELYGEVFQREIELYDPLVYADTAETVVLTGKDFTMRSFLKSTKYLRSTEELEPIPEDDPANVQEETDFRSQEINNIYNLIRYLEGSHDRVLFITTKERKKLVEEQLLKNYPDMRVDFDHYGNVRGSNAYKDHDAIVVWGAYREPYTSVYRRVQAWSSYMGMEDFVPYKITYKMKPYHSRWEAHSYSTFVDDFPDRFVEMIEAGEVRQALDRIRPHTSDEPKTVYVVMSRPVAPWITRLLYSSPTLKKIGMELDEELMLALSDYYWEHKKLPPYRQTSKMFRKGNRALREQYELWETEQSSELDEKARNCLQSLNEYNTMDITYSDLEIDWRLCKAMLEEFNEVTAIAAGIPAGEY